MSQYFIFARVRARETSRSGFPHRRSQHHSLDTAPLSLSQCGTSIILQVCFLVGREEFKVY
jgi:hypothetical protein